MSSLDTKGFTALIMWLKFDFAFKKNFTPFTVCKVKLIIHLHEKVSLSLRVPLDNTGITHRDEHNYTWDSNR